MQDVMDNMQELALDAAFCGTGADFEILALEPARVPNPAPAPTPSIRSPFSAAIQSIRRPHRAA